MSLWNRLLGMGLTWGMVGLVYSLSGLRGPEGAYHLQPWALDLLLPYSTLAIWPYLSFFLLVTMGYLCAKPADFLWMCRAVLLCALGAGLVFAFFPTTMDFPPVLGEGLSEALLRLLIAHDAMVNCLPSLHVALSLIAAKALGASWPDGRRLLVWLWAGLICLSILVLRRHQIVDLLSGALLALGAGYAASLLRLKFRFAKEVSS